MKLVGHGHDHDLARRQRGDRFAVESGWGRAVAIGPGAERLTGEGAQQRFGTRQIAHGGEARRADGDLADAALALHVIKRRQKLIVGDHAAADDQYLSGQAIRPAAACAVHGFGEGFFEGRDAIEDGRFGDHQRRADLDGGAAEAHRAEHQHAFFDGAAHHVPGQIAIGFLGAGNDAGEARHQAFAIHAPDLRSARSQRAELLVQHAAHAARVLGEVLAQHQIDGGQRRGAANRIAGVRGGHAAGGLQIHHVRAAGDGGQRQRTGDALAEERQVRHDAVVLEAPQRAGTAEAGLHFVAHQQRFVAGAPRAQVAHVCGGRKGGAAALVGFQDHAGHVLRLDRSFRAGCARTSRRKCPACG